MTRKRSRKLRQRIPKRKIAGKRRKHRRKPLHSAQFRRKFRPSLPSFPFIPRPRRFFRLPSRLCLPLFRRFPCLLCLKFPRLSRLPRKSRHKFRRRRSKRNLLHAKTWRQYSTKAHAALTRTAAVAALKNLGFGKSAAYDALSADGRFSAWLQFAPDGINYLDGMSGKPENRLFPRGIVRNTAVSACFR